MISNKNLESLERKYFNTVYNCLNKNLRLIIRRLKAGDKIKKDWIKIANEKKTNIFDVSAEKIFNWVLSNKLKWNCLPIPISSDECFELSDAVVHIDIKTVLATERYDIEIEGNTIKFLNLIVGINQTTLPKKKVSFQGGKIDWNPNLPAHYTFNSNTKVCLTYFIRLAYNLICPFCGEIQDVGPSKQQQIKNHFNSRVIKKHICAPFGSFDYSTSHSCKKHFFFPSFRLEDITLYCFPNAQLIGVYYKNKQWFHPSMPYKSSIKKGGNIVGISGARIKIESFSKPSKKPSWWTKKNEWARFKSLKFKPTDIIKGK